MPKAALEFLTAETPRLVIRPVSEEDYEAFVAGYRACSAPRNQFDEGAFDTAFMTRSWYAALLDRRRREAAGDVCYMLNVFDRQDGRSLGYCDVTTQWREAFQCARIGYTIHNPYWGRGLGTECVRALVRLAFDRLNFHRLEAHIHPDNAASQRVAQKAGLAFETVRKGYILEQGVWTDNAVYYINNPDWKEPAPRQVGAYPPQF